MMITILYGTESGNSEMVAEDLAAALRDDHEVAVADLADTDPAGLDPAHLHLVVSSTYGDGELPKSAYPFYRRLKEETPALGGLRYLAFGLGDSDYVYSYGLGIETLDQELQRHGAERIGDIGRHDASEDGDPSETAQAWLNEKLALLLAPTP
ncbi:flavodoxin domain-containing protein [Leucobacter soli]|uniref:Cindoxin n=1 Tax=Leucobacter soli TaxID=2812850 RepID=A0A916NHI4_9MICO|nr:flavodoxin domain-containing protein [Leucobacter soli]CAG7610379.1 Cindoxin [Leucobacter soli]